MPCTRPASRRAFFWSKRLRWQAAIGWAVVALSAAGLSGRVQALDLEQLLLRAEQGDSQVSNALDSRRVAQDRLEDVKRRFNPTVTLGVNASNYSANLSGIPGADTGRQYFHSSTASIAVTQPLYNPLREVNIEEQELRVESEQLQLLQTRNDLAVKLVQVLLDLAAADQAIESAQTEAAWLGELMAATRASDAKADLSSYRIRQLQAEGQARMSRNLRRQRESELMRMVPQAPSVSFRPASGAEPVLPVMEIPSEEDSLVLALRHNLSLRRAALEVRLAELSVKRATRDRYPTVDVVAAGGITRGMPTFPSARSDSAVVGVQINLPLMDGGLNSNVRREALAQESKARNDLEAAKRLVQQNVVDTYYEQLNAATQLETELKILGLAAPATAPGGATAADPQAWTADWEARISRLISMREVHRLRRESLLQRLRLWALCGPLESRELRAVAGHFQ